MTKPRTAAKSMRSFVLILLAALAPDVLYAQASASGGSACSAEEHRKFDFWLGEWVVTDSSGTEIGRSEIVREAEGCAIREAWTGRSGVTGTSLNYFDPADGRWHQHWVGGGGMILNLTGGLEDGTMVLSSDRTTPEGSVRDRISWTPMPGQGVRQEWEISKDGGMTWQTVFLGFYRPR